LKEENSRLARKRNR